MVTFPLHSALALRWLVPAIGTNAEHDWSAFMARDGMGREENEEEEEDEDEEDDEDDDDEDEEEDEHDEEVDVGVIELDLAVSLVKDLLNFTG